MRPSRFRVVRPLVLSLVILSCATENAVGPLETPTRASAIVEANGMVDSKVVISQVYGGGGNSGAKYKNDFVEIFNRSADTVDVKDWSVQYASSNGTSWTKATLSGKIPPGGYQLIQEAAGANSLATPLPDPNATGAAAMSGTSGKVALVTNTNSLTCTTVAACQALHVPAGPIADYVGYGTAATVFEGTGGTATLSNTTAAFRKGGGCTDTDDNAADFVVGAPFPQNSQTEQSPCGSGGGAGAKTVTVRTSWVTPQTTFRVTASAVDENGRPADNNFSWSVTPTSVATVDPATGVVTGVAVGVATITATASNGVTGSASLFVVNPGDVASVSISINDPAQVPVNFTKPAFPTSKTTTGATVTPELVWSTSDPAIATVTSLGYVTGVAAGKVSVRATAPDGVYGEVPFTVLSPDAPTGAIYRNAVEFGQPSNGAGPNDIILAKKQYTESYNASRGGPNWVSWEINATQFGGAPRCDCFSADLTLPDNVYRVVDFDYRNGGYDRGHMVQSESRTTTDQENASTFLLTNILPQGAENNQGPWSKFENYLNDVARGTSADPTKHEIYVIAGGRYGSNPGTLKDEGKVAIPDYTWKIAVIMPEGKGLADVHSVEDVNVIAVEMPNLVTPGVPATSVGIRNIPWEQYKTTVDEIEAETRYDFLANLPDRIEILVESGDHAPVAAWSGATSGAEGSAIGFDASGSTDADNDALTYAWDFGDGTTSSGASVSHIYVDNGDYVATLTVKDPTGADDSQTRTIHVANLAPVVGSVTATGTVYSGESVFATATFSDAGTADSPWTYSFDWGAGSTSQGVTGDQSSQVGSSRSFLAAGTYTVAFNVTDKDAARSETRNATFRVLRLPTTLVVNPQRINLQGNSNGQVIVTLLGTRTIAASAIDVGTVRIGNVDADQTGADGFKAAQEDVDGDGIADLVIHFRRNALMADGQLTSRTTQLTLRANLNDGRQIEARGPVTVSAKE